MSSTEQTPAPAPQLKGAAKQAAMTKGRLDLHRKAIDGLREDSARLRAELAHLAEQQSAIEPRTMAAAAPGAAPGPPLRGLTPDELEVRRAEVLPMFLQIRGETPPLDPPPADDRPHPMWQLRDGQMLMSTRPGWMEQRSTADPITDPLGITPGTTP